MPYLIRKGAGPRPYKIVKRSTGRIVGTSLTMDDARASIRARYLGEHRDAGRTRTKRLAIAG